MALQWIQVDANLSTHRKSVHLAALIGDQRAWTYPVQLWAWASQNQPDGFVRGSAAKLVVEHVSGWRGEPGKLYESMLEAGWLDAQEDGVFIHDWPDHQGAHIAKAEKDAERQRERRATVHRTYGGRPSAVQRKTKTKKKTKKKIKEEASAPKEPEAPPARKAQPEAKPPDEQPCGSPSGNESSPADLKAAWNELKAPEQPEWVEMPPDRAKAAAARLKDRPLEGWRVVIRRLAASRFARGLKPGADGRRWIANPTFLLRPGSAAKVLEGTYDDPGGYREPVDVAPEPCAYPGCPEPAGATAFGFRLCYGGGHLAEATEVAMANTTADLIGRGVAVEAWLSQPAENRGAA